jgi:hypothetical protein
MGRTVFVSYSRQNEAVVQSLVGSLRAFGHDVWFDRLLAGGQPWWDEILRKIQGGEVFLFALAPDSLNSEACRRELSYAVALGKPILPVLVANGVSMNLLPSGIARLQIVDVTRSPDASFTAARIVEGLPRSPPLPTSLPRPPEIPQSYLVGIQDDVDFPGVLDAERQGAIVLRLKHALRTPETSSDAVIVLRRMQSRRDLLAFVGAEIEELLNGRTAFASYAQSRIAVATPEKAAQEPVKRVKGAFGVAIVAFSLCALVVGEDTMFLMPLAGIAGLGGLIAGALTGTRPRYLWTASFFGVVGWLVIAADNGDHRLANGAITGLPAGLIVGALLAVTLGWLRRMLGRR